VVSEDVTVIDSEAVKRVVLPAASFGVIVKVADSELETDAEDALRVNDAGAFAREQTTVANGSAA
jgi:hypothetical protein